MFHGKNWSGKSSGPIWPIIYYTRNGSQYEINMKLPHYIGFMVYTWHKYGISPADPNYAGIMFYLIADVWECDCVHGWEQDLGAVLCCQYVLTVGGQARRRFTRPSLTPYM